MTDRFTSTPNGVTLFIKGTPSRIISEDTNGLKIEWQVPKDITAMELPSDVIITMWVIYKNDIVQELKDNVAKTYRSEMIARATLKHYHIKYDPYHNKDDSAWKLAKVELVVDAIVKDV